MNEQIKTNENNELYFEKEIPVKLKDNIMFKVMIECKEFTLIKNIIGAIPNDKIKVNNRDYLLVDIRIENSLIFIIKES